MSDTDGASPLLSAKEAISLWLLGAKKVSFLSVGVMENKIYEYSVCVFLLL